MFTGLLVFTRKAFFFFDRTGVWIQVIVIAKQVLTKQALYHLNHFVLVILEMGSHKLFAWVGLKPWSSW
jgi:hypothetical protein